MSIEIDLGGVLGRFTAIVSLVCILAYLIYLVYKYFLKKIFNIVWGKEERAREKEKKDIKSIVFKLKEQGKTEEEISDYLIKKEYSVKEIETSFKEKSKWNKKELLETIKREKEELKKLEKPIFSLYDEQGMVSSKLVIFIFLCLLGIVPGVIYLFWTISNKDSKKELIRVLEEDLKKLK